MTGSDKDVDTFLENLTERLPTTNLKNGMVIVGGKINLLYFFNIFWNSFLYSPRGSRSFSANVTES